jgi:acetolactate synthase I/II/III large subunit
MERGAGLPVVERVPYILDQARDKLRPFRQLILVGSRIPVAYFAYPGKDPVALPKECMTFTLASTSENCASALEMLGQAVQAREVPGVRTSAHHSPDPSGPITLIGLAAAVAATLPENAIVVDEAMTSGYPMLGATQTAPRHDWLANTGGSIGIALPLAVGAAIACPARRVLCLSADGSGMYTLQALWTMAREKLNVTVVVFANRTYGVLKREFAGLGIGVPGQRASDMLEIGRPDLDWVSLAKGMGVRGNKVSSLEDFSRRLSEGFGAQGPTLIEVPL